MHMQGLAKLLDCIIEFDLKVGVCVELHGFFKVIGIRIIWRYHDIFKNNYLELELFNGAMIYLKTIILN